MHELKRILTSNPELKPLIFKMLEYSGFPESYDKKEKEKQESPNN